ncbi:MAG: hypothetical protein AABY30_01035 [Candidatus Thermoplasmatota archaeon]
MGDPQVRGDRFGGALAAFEEPAGRSRSFAELVAALNRLNGLEAALATAIARARVPLPEVRQLLRAQTPAQAENAPAFQFMREVFSQVGIPLDLESVGPFALTFAVDASPYARLFAADAPRRTCGFVSEALSRFLGTSVGLPADVDEVACRNEGAPRCRFGVALDPVAASARALDASDWRLFEALSSGVPPSKAAQDLGLGDDERDYRMEVLISHGLVRSDGGLLPNGGALAAAGPVPAEDPREPPWRDVSRLTEAIAFAASAAEALVEVAPRMPARDDAPDAETAALAAECHSFAEFLARASKGRSWE